MEDVIRKELVKLLQWMCQEDMNPRYYLTSEILQWYEESLTNSSPSESQSVVDNEDEEKSSCSCSDLNTVFIEGYGSVIIWQIEEDDSSGR